MTGQRIVTLPLSTLVLCVAGMSQDTGAINGHVVDATEAAVPGVTVEAINQDTHLSRRPFPIRRAFSTYRRYRPAPIH